MSITEETRREAYYEAQSTAPTRRYEIYRLLKACGPMSSEEIMGRMRIYNPNCIRPRLSELKECGLIESCGKTKSKYGNNQIAVWQVVGWEPPVQEISIDASVLQALIVEERRKYMAEWRKNNKDKVRQANQRYWKKKVLARMSEEQ